MSVVDVVVVGGGVAGSVFAGRLAAAGWQVLVLERERQFSDKVRSEYLAPWGVHEAIELGVWPAICAAPGANLITESVGYDETLLPMQAEAARRDVAGFLPGVPGALGIGHPALCEALLADAAAKGATVRRGVQDVLFDHSEPLPRVRFLHDGDEIELQAGLLIGADGKESNVRRKLAVTVQQTEPRVMLSGMLVADAFGWPSHWQCVGVEGDRHFMFFPQADGVVRAYLGWGIDDPHRFSGPQRQQLFLETCRLQCAPPSMAIAEGRSAGPIATDPMTDAWLETPVQGDHDRIVFVGDAAGWSNPLISQGLSVALRDARVLSDALLDASIEIDDALRAYATERNERMRRLRVCSAINDLIYDFGPAARLRRQRIRALAGTDDVLGGPRHAQAVGPWRVPEEAFGDDVRRILTAA